MTKLSERLRRMIVIDSDVWNTPPAIAEAADLLEECERALDGVLNNALQDIDVQMRKDEFARATLDKLRAQERD